MTDIQLKEIVKEIYIDNLEYKVISKPENSYIEVKTDVAGRQVKLFVCFPKGFPYQFPEIIVENSELKKLPHIDRYGKICLFNQNAMPNHEIQVEVIKESILKAIKIIDDGIKGFNKSDFTEEFNAYWENGMLGTMDVLFEPSDSVKKLKCIHSDKNEFWCCGDDYKDTYNYARISSENEELIEEDAIYIPLNSNIFPPFPRNNREIFEIMLLEKNFFDYEKFLTNRKGRIIIIFSQKYNDGYILFGIFHTGIGDLKGFRKGKIAPRVAYLGKYAKSPIIKFGINLINRKRLYYRGGDGTMINKKISILGCGSLGGYLVSTLTEMGVNDFKFVDNEKITTENIARHICGIKYVGMCKPDAVNQKIIEHYPNLKTEVYNLDIYKFLTDNIEELEDREINFIAVGDKSLESYIIKKYNDGEIRGILIIVWVEPYIIGGHAIILNKKQSNVEKIIYDEQWELKNRILENPGEFTKKEAGCQNSFIQYSGFEANYFIHNLLDNIFNGAILGSDKNYLLTIAGKIDWARKEQFNISSKWIIEKDRKIEIEEL